MDSSNLILSQTNLDELKHEIRLLEDELKQVEQRIQEFEHTLRTALINELVEERELSVLYKSLKRAKKEKRLEQKKRGKNYKEPVGLKPVSKQAEPINPEDQKERKRLYREAMFHVHPDNFSMQDADHELATETTAKLIEVYNAGSLSELQAFHAHIVSGIALGEASSFPKPAQGTVAPDAYLKQEIARLEKQLAQAKARHIYFVLTEYENPLSFIDELRAYYNDRIAKLRKRTRKGK